MAWPAAIAGSPRMIGASNRGVELESQEITWRCWWEGGTERPNCARWRLNYVPMVYVLDACGIIRAKDVRGKAIDDIVDELVEQTETHAGNSD
jgi:hypothetical protein